ncbi:MAG: aldehyde dehydrogenase family protein, partial [Edaphobacter sp.]
SDMGPIRIDAVRELLSEQVEDALARGAKLHTTWARGSDRVTPLVFTDLQPEAHLLTQESFGPVVCVAPFHSEEEAIQLANSTSFALSASIFIGDTNRGQRIAAQLNSGTCAVNDVIRNIGNPQASFGGNRASGYGRYHGPSGLHTFSRTKTVMVVTRPRHREIHWFPFTSRTFERLRGLLLVRHRSAPLLSKMKNLLHLLVLAGMLCACTLVQAASASSLSLNVSLPPGERGIDIAYLVFSSADGFPNVPEKSLLHGFIPVTSPAANHQPINLGLLAPGRYAVAVYLDVNGNHKLDKRFLGIPKEPVGASNNPKGHMEPPHFNECSFIHGSEAQVIAITLVK